MKSRWRFVAAALASLSSVGYPADPPPVAWCASIEIAKGAGIRGEWRQNESRYDYVDDPTIALDAHGAASVAWVDQRRKDVFFQRYERKGKPRLRTPVNVSRTPQVFSWLPRIALSPRHPDDVYVLWQEIVFSGGSHGGDIFFARSRNGGAVFDRPVNLSNSVPGDGKGRISRDVWHNGSLDIAVAPDGTLYAAWTEYDGPLWLSRSSNRGATFSKPVEIQRGDDKPARAPALAVAADGTLYLAWTVGEDDRADIRLSVSSDNGRTFTTPRIVAETPGYSDAPKIAVDSKGTLHLVHAESARGPFDRYHVRYLRSRDRGRSFEGTRQIAGGASFPHLAIDAADNLYIVWESVPDHRQRPAGLGFAMSRDAGASFAAAPTLSQREPGGGLQGLLMRKLSVNAAGDIGVVNSSFKDGEASRVSLVLGASGSCSRRPR